MEDEGLIHARWIPEDAGRPRKWYSISAKGRESLRAYAEDIGKRLLNFQFFLDRYSSMERKA